MVGLKQTPNGFSSWRPLGTTLEKIGRFVVKVDQVRL